MSELKKIRLIGLDGASFEILKPMMDTGKLPVLSSLIENGASGALRSNAVPFTPQAWTSVITGNNPGKHGIFGFVRQTPGQPPVFSSSRAIKGEKLWSLFSRRGLKSLIINVPVTFPPEPLNGLMVTGMMTPSEKVEFTYPAGLKSRILKDWPDYRLDVPSGINRSRDLSILDELDSAMSARADLLMTLAKEENPDLVFIVFAVPDRIQHAFAQLIDPRSTAFDSETARRWRERIYESYTKLDRVIGQLLASEEDTNTIFISDHGFTVERGAFFTNDFLKARGLLSLKKNPGYGLAGSAIGRLNISALKRIIPNQLIKKTIKFTKAAIDWSETKAYSSPVTQSGIFINLSGREPNGVVARGDYERVRDEIIDGLHALKDPDTNAPIVKASRREEIFSGESIETIPDIVLDFEQSGLEAKDSVLGGEAVQWSDGGSRGIHHRDGIFIAHGPDVKAGSFDGLRLEDIAPNVLALAGLDVPPGLDGKLRDDIFNIKVKEVTG